MPAAYRQRVTAAHAQPRDAWGEQLLAARDGPTFDAARRFLEPLLLARGPQGRDLTESGVYYLPFGDPPGPQGGTAVALHVADGGQILLRHVAGRSLTILVGRSGDERYGSCLTRLVRARLRGGYLPVVQTGYTDENGARYAQESFSTRGAGAALTTFIELGVDATRASAESTVRFAGSDPSGATVMRVPPGTRRDVYVAWSGSAGARMVTDTAYVAARDGLERRWRTRLEQGMRITVPEPRVENAERALLIQNLVLGWRYSIGNPYEEFSFPESPDVAQVMGAFGFGDVERAILEVSLARPSHPYGNWKRGERLLVSAAHFRRFHDRAYIDSATPVLAEYVTQLGRELGRSGPPILGRERFSSDIPDLVYGFHAQAVAWAGLRAMADVWARTGRGRLAERSLRLAEQLHTGLTAAVRTSQRRLPDGSLFVPARLLDRELPYHSLVEARAGSYWNLVMPFAFATGFFPPGSAEARGVRRYMLLHGSRLLGLVRAGAYALYGRAAPFPVSGTDEVYGVNAARFLADNDEPDQLVLSLYGQLAAAMTPDTFVAGEGASVAPLAGRRDRAMYLPPNAASNAAFLETLRLMLVHETTDAGGRPLGLELAYATPRAWLRPGATIAVERAPTSFGPLSYSVTVAERSARIRIDVPARAVPKRLALRLRLPGGSRIESLRLRGRPFGRFDADSGTIDLSGESGRLLLEAALTAARR